MSLIAKVSCHLNTICEKFPITLNKMSYYELILCCYKLKSTQEVNRHILPYLNIIDSQEEESIFIKGLEGQDSVVVWLGPPQPVGALEVTFAIETNSYHITRCPHQLLPTPGKGSM